MRRKRPDYSGALELGCVWMDLAPTDAAQCAKMQGRMDVSVGPSPQGRYCISVCTAPAGTVMATATSSRRASRGALSMPGAEAAMSTT